MLAIGFAQQAEQVCGGLAQVAGGAEAPAERADAMAEPQQDLAVARGLGLDPDRGVGGVVGGQATGRAMPLPALGQRTDQGLDLFAGHGAGPQQGDAAVQNRHNRTLHSDSAGAAIDGGGDRVPGLLKRIGEGGGAGPARAVGRRGDDRAAERRENGAGLGVAGNAHGDAVQPGAGQVADLLAVADRSHDGQGPGPEGFGQGAGGGVEDGDGLSRRRVGHMGDQRVEARPALGLEDRGDGGGVGGVGGQAIDGFGRQHDEASLTQGVGCGLDGVAVELGHGAV